MNDSSAMEARSNVFNDGGYIPVRYTCSGEDISPPIEWSEAPRDTKSFVLVMDDPDAPVGTWDHWVIYNIPAAALGLGENIPKKGTLADGARQGINDFKRLGYGGPCPPSGKPHRYVFRLFALDAAPELKPGLDKDSVLRLIRKHVIASSELTGLFKR